MGKEKNTRKSTQRTAILKELRKMHTHPTAEELYTRVREIIPNISLGTVYRNLEFLAKQGEISCFDFAKTMKWDGNHKYHHHIFCLNCSRLDDINPQNARIITAFEEFDQMALSLKDMMKAEIPENANENHNQYQIHDFCLVFRGLCPECQQSQELHKNNKQKN